MAILTPSRPPRSSGRKRDRGQASLADTASGWLSHPMADAVLVLVPTMILYFRPAREAAARVPAPAEAREAAPTPESAG